MLWQEIFLSKKKNVPSHCAAAKRALIIRPEYTELALSFDPRGTIKNLVELAEIFSAVRKPNELKSKNVPLYHTGASKLGPMLN